ncbi:RagB/SusD family nutrient uptake outer membrane protein [Parapedobacter sp. 2B3]|uniref:RagB/SusD family nutrient uptake outer membrane protein n=1 Tax=Parapedobacter sp. 2B3 TaxID=3342381 RepID=UPI0035B57CA0
MKQQIKIYSMLLTATIALSCSGEFLNLSSNTEISSATLYKSEEDVKLVVNGVYKQLQSNSIYGGSFNTGGVCSIVEYDSFTDNTWNWYLQVGPGALTRGEADPANAFFYNTWSAHYRGIARCNDAISNIEKMDEALIKTESKQAYLGQLYFLRALFYFNLAVYYDEVPLLVVPQTLENPYPVKNSQQAVFEQVISDLNFAVDVLPVVYPAELIGYATQGAALGLLARVELYTGNWRAVDELTRKIIDLGIYNLDFPYDRQFTPEGELSGDVVFSVRFDDMPGFNVGELFSRTQTGMADPTHQPLANLVNDYYCVDGLPVSTSPLFSQDNEKLDRDPRLLATIYFNGDQFNLDLPNLKVNTLTGYGVRKYVRDQVTDKGTMLNQAGGQDYYLIRYADVLLMRAEALIEQDKDFVEAASLINQVRDRVGMPAIENAEGDGLPQSELRAILRHERRVEFALEGLRFLDLKRWELVEEAYSIANIDAEEIPSMPSYVYRGVRSEVFPVPQRELDANPNLDQHDAWK